MLFFAINLFVLEPIRTETTPRESEGLAALEGWRLHTLMDKEREAETTPRESEGLAALEWSLHTLMDKEREAETTPRESEGLAALEWRARSCSTHSRGFSHWDTSVLQL